MDRRQRSRLLILPFTAWFFLLMVAPFVLILITSFFRRTELGVTEPAFQLDAYRQLLDPVYMEIVWRTLLLALGNTFITLVVAYPFAFFLSRLPRKRAMVMLTFVMIPFWTNFLIRILAFMDILRLHLFGLNLTYTFSGILLAMAYNYLPFAVLPLYSTMEKIENSVLEAAYDLGASKIKILFRVLLPLSKQGISSAGILVFIPSLGEFLIPEIVGGGKNFFLGTFLHHQFLVARNWPLGSAAISCLILLAILLLVLARKSLGESRQ